MRPAKLMRWSAVLALVAFAALLLAAGLSFRSALAAKIDRAAAIEKEAARPAAAARLAAALLERRLASVGEPASRAVASAFGHSDASRALADYRAAGGDPSIVAEAEKAMSREGREAQADIALMRAIRGLRAEADRLPRPSPPPAPPAAARGWKFLAAGGAAAAAAALLAHVAGRAAAKP